MIKCDQAKFTELSLTSLDQFWSFDIPIKLGKWRPVATGPAGRLRRVLESVLQFLKTTAVGSEPSLLQNIRIKVFKVRTNHQKIILWWVFQALKTWPSIVTRWLPASAGCQVAADPAPTRNVCKRHAPSDPGPLEDKKRNRKKQPEN